MLHTDTRTEILDAATEVVSERGPDGATTREICDRAGVTAPTLYHYFGDKQGLLDAVVTRAFDRYLARKQALPVTGDPRRDVCAGWDEHASFARANPVLYQLMWPPGNAPLPEAATASAAHLRAHFTRLADLGALRPGITAAHAARTLSAALRGVTAAIARDPQNPDNMSLSDTVRDAIVDALLVPEPTD